MVLTARYPSVPGAPKSAPHSAGATTASTVFSASDSTTALVISEASRSLGSRPTRAGSSWRARDRSWSSSAAAMSRPASVRAFCATEM